MHCSESRLPPDQIPAPEDLAEWVKNALFRLEMRPANFLRDEKRPGSVNRVQRFLKNPEVVKVTTARRLLAEIATAARDRHVTLEPIPVKQAADGKQR